MHDYPIQTLHCKAKVFVKPQALVVYISAKLSCFVSSRIREAFTFLNAYYYSEPVPYIRDINAIFE